MSTKRCILFPNFSSFPPVTSLLYMSPFWLMFTVCVALAWYPLTIQLLIGLSRSFERLCVVSRHSILNYNGGNCSSFKMFVETNPMGYTGERQTLDCLLKLHIDMEVHSHVPIVTGPSSRTGEDGPSFRLQNLGRILNHYLPSTFWSASPNWGP